MIVFTNSAWGQALNYYGSVSFTTGTYIFTERTNSLFLLNGISLKIDRSTLSFGVPVIFQNAPWISSSGVGMIPSGGTASSQVGKKSANGKIALPDTTGYEKIGVGDPIFHAAIRLSSERKVIPEISFTADLKFPLAEVDRGFGTGEWDYAFGISFSKAITETFLFVDISYWFIGDMPDLVLHDTVAYSLAIGIPFDAGEWALMASFYGNSSTVGEVDPPLQINLGLNHNLSSGSSLNAGVGIGLTESAPDFSVSLGWWLGG